MEFFQLEGLSQREILSGCKARFIHSDSMTCAYWEIDEGAVLPEHAHSHEQILNLLEGTFELTVGDESRVLKSRSVVVIPPNVSHSGRAISNCRIIDVFHPVREDFKE